MYEHHLFYELVMIIYACSVLLYFIDFLHYNRKVNLAAFWLLSIVWLLQLMFFILRGIHEQAIPLFSKFDTLLFYSWVLISLSLLANWFFRMDFLLFFANLIGFTVMAFSLYMVGHEVTHPLVAEQLRSEWLIIHIFMAFLSYAAFTISFIFSGIYLLQHHWLKKKKWYKQFRRWPSLDQLDRYSFYFNLLGVPLLMLSLILGIIWAYQLFSTSFWYDSKVIFSLFALFMYTIYLYQRVAKGWLGKKIVELNIICFLVLLVNYLISSFFSDFHLWM